MVLVLSYLAVSAAFYASVIARAPIEKEPVFAAATGPCEVIELFPSADTARKAA